MSRKKESENRKRRLTGDGKNDFQPYFLWRWAEKLIGLKWALMLYSPYLGAGVRLKELSKNYDRIVVEMKQRFWNTNYVGVHFGGSLYAMCDPFFMFLLMKRLGPSYIVWDQAGSIEFVRPGQGKVRAEFSLDQSRLDEIKARVEKDRKSIETFYVSVMDEKNRVVSRVEKKIYVRKMRQRKGQ